MNPAIGLLTPVKAAIGQWLSAWHAQVYPDTPAFAEWAGRATHEAMAWAPARMVDSVEDMLSSWARNDNSGRPATSAYRPVVFIAVASDYTEPPGETGRPMTDRVPFSFAADDQRRSFRIRVLGADLRAQVVVVAHDAPTTSSMMAQLSLWTVERQRFKANYPFAGFSSEWPVTVLQADRMAITTPLGEQVSILSLDLTLRATMPMFYGPRDGEATDGNDPPGFPVVGEVNASQGQPDWLIGRPTGVSDAEWSAYLRLLSHSSRTSDVVLLPIQEGQRG